MSESSSAQLIQEVVLSTQQCSSGKLSIITLNRPKKFNALSGWHYKRLSNLMRQVSEDQETIATIIVGTGKFFSAGADVNAAGAPAPDEGDIRDFYLGRFAIGNLDITRQFFYHKHPLFICLNGPVIGMTAAVVAYGDFIYATPDTYLLTPFASLGLAPEGASSLMFPLKMGYALANRALIGGEALTCEELKQGQFVSKIFPRDGFVEATLKHIVNLLEDKNIESMHIAKGFLQETLKDQLEKMNTKEVVAATDRFAAGIPQAQFMRLANKDKKHKL